MNRRDQKRFDALVRDVIGGLPADVSRRLDEIAVIVEDYPSDDLVDELIRDGVLEAGDDGLDLCGLHTGTPLTERSVDVGGWGGTSMPDAIYLFREGIVSLALDDDGLDGAWGPGSEGEVAVLREIRVTLLHEIGHHFGLDEDDLAGLGYD